MRTTLLASMVFAACLGCYADELLSNPSFESGDFSGWKVSGGGWLISDQNSSEGLKAAECSVKKGDARGARVCMQQIGLVEQGRIVEVTLDAAAIDVARTPNSKACLAVVCFDAKGKVLKEYRSSIVRPTSEFQHIKIDDAVVLPRTAQIYVMLVVEVYQPADDDDRWRFDNVRVQIK